MTTTLTPNKENIQKLVNALRSGKYKQTIGKLRTIDKEECFCAEGIACDITGLGEWDNSYYVVKSSNTMSKHTIPYYILTNFYGLPGFTLNVTPEEQNRICSHANNAECNIRKYGIVLNRLNDAGFSFKEIADIIERSYLN